MKGAMHLYTPRVPLARGVPFMGRRQHGEGTVTKLPSGSFRAELGIGTSVDGKQKRIRQTFKTRREADKWLTEQRAAHYRGEIAEPSTITVAEYAQRWMSQKRLTLKPGTIGTYESLVAQIVADGTNRLGGLVLSHVKKQNVEAWMAQLEADGLPVDRRRKLATHFRSIVLAAIEDRILVVNPTKKVPKPKIARKEMRFWNADQARSVIRLATTRRLGAILVLALDSGMRAGELLALRWPQVDLKAGTVRVIRTLYQDKQGKFHELPPKSAASRRTIKLAASTVAVLAAHRKAMKAEGRDVEEGVVFAAKRSGGFLDYNTFYRRYFGDTVRKAGVPMIRPHDMRHTSATLLLAAGVGIKVVSQRLGHEDIVTTLRLYAHVMADQQDAAATAMEGLLNPAPTNSPRNT